MTEFRPVLVRASLVPSEAKTPKPSKINCEVCDESIGMTKVYVRFTGLRFARLYRRPSASIDALVLV